MEEKKSCITINCGCCGSGEGNGTAGVVPTIGENGNWYIGEQDTGVAAQGPAGVFGNLALLFQGEAGTIGELYPLDGMVTDYSSLLVEISMKYYNVVRDYMMLPKPEITDSNTLYARFLCDNLLNGVLEPWRIFWRFTEGNKLMIENLTKSSVDGTVGNVLAITRVFGIR